MCQVTERYAIYFSPADDSELDIFGATVLRRRATDAKEWLHPALPVEFPASVCWSTQSQVPSRYGFHATIKAPFTLAEGQSIDQLQQDLANFSNTQKPIPLPGLAPMLTSRYHSLAFEQQPEPLRQMAAACVQQFEPFRAPLTEADIKRRDPASLTPRQQDYLKQYGYPYVLDDFNFHMTLAGATDNKNSDYLQWLGSLYESIVKETPVLDRLSIFYQPDRNTAFVRKSEFLFGSAS